MKKSCICFCIALLCGIAFVIFLKLMLNCETDKEMETIYGSIMLFPLLGTLGFLYLTWENLKKEKPAWVEWLTSQGKSDSQTEGNSGIIWMWLLGLPILTLIKIISREPGQKKRR